MQSSLHQVDQTTLMRSRRRRPPVPTKRREPDLTSLINIVFLILIFFIVTGTMRPFSARDVKLAKIAQEAGGRVSASSLVIRRDGRVFFGGRDVTLDELTERVGQAGQPARHLTFTIVADGRSPGPAVVDVSRALRSAGVTSISVMVERKQR